MAAILFSESIETTVPDEAQITREIVARMGANQLHSAERHRHAHRDAHAKSHAVLKGHMRVHDDLPPELAQGIFSRPRTYEIVARLSSAQGDIHSDEVPAPRGFAAKVIGVEGERLAPELGGANQDFLMVNIPVLAFGDIKKYQKMLGPLERKAGSPEAVQKLGAAVARGASRLVESFGGTLGATLQGLASSNAHMLGETFHTQAAIRFGRHVAKLSLTPEGALRGLSGQSVGDGFSSMRDAVAAWFADNGAQFRLNAQLCTDLDAMPVEDAAVLWDPNASPHCPVATLEFPAQAPYSPERQVHGDDHLAFNPWNGIQDHRPLGSIMRVRRAAYENSSEQRHRLNALPRREPDSLSEIPD